MFTEGLAEMWGRSSEGEKRHLKMLALCAGMVGISIADKLAYHVVRYLTQSPEIANLAVTGAEIVGFGVLTVVLVCRMRGRERLQDHTSRVGNGVAWEMPQPGFVVGGVVWRNRIDLP